MCADPYNPPPVVGARARRNGFSNCTAPATINSISVKVWKNWNPCF